MMSKAETAVLLCILLGGLACSSQGEPPAVKAQTDLPAPEYHFPRRAWRAEHPVLVQPHLGWKNNARGFFQVQECLLCHNAAESCNKCHAYLGAALIGGHDDGGK